MKRLSHLTGALLVLAALAAAPASAAPRAGSLAVFGNDSTPMQGAVIAHQTEGTISGRVLISAPQGFAYVDHAGFNFSPTPCNRPPARVTEFASGQAPQGKTALNMPFAVDVDDPQVLRSARSFRITNNNRTLVCARLRQYSPSPTGAKPDLLVAENFRDQGIDILLIVTPGAKRFRYTAMAPGPGAATGLSGAGSARTAPAFASTFQRIEFTLLGGSGTKPCPWYVPEMDSDTSAMAVSRGSAKYGANRLKAMTKLRIKGDGKTLSTTRIDRYAAAS